MIYYLQSIPMAYRHPPAAYTDTAHMPCNGRTYLAGRTSLRSILGTNGLEPLCLRLMPYPG